MIQHPLISSMTTQNRGGISGMFRRVLVHCEMENSSSISSEVRHKVVCTAPLLMLESHWPLLHKLLSVDGGQNMHANEWHDHENLRRHITLTMILGLYRAIN